MKQENTKERIESCAVKEFLEKGFNGASLRQIVKEAGVTTGAFYKYYPTKEALYAGLAEPVVSHICSIYDENYHAFVQQTADDQIQNMVSNDVSLTKELIDYIYDHHEIVRMILTSSEGTPYADFEHNLAVKEEKSTMAFAALLNKNGMNIPELDEEFVHMISSGMISAAFEVVLHNMDKSTAYQRIQMLQTFYTAGWEKIFGIQLQDHSDHMQA